MLYRLSYPRFRSGRDLNPQPSAPDNRHIFGSLLAPKNTSDTNRRTRGGDRKLCPHTKAGVEPELIWYQITDFLRLVSRAFVSRHQSQPLRTLPNRQDG